MKEYTIDRLLKKSTLTVWEYFFDRGYFVSSYEDNTIEASYNHAGVCIKYAVIKFNNKGRCISAVMHEC